MLRISLQSFLNEINADPTTTKNGKENKSDVEGFIETPVPLSLKVCYISISGSKITSKVAFSGAKLHVLNIKDKNREEGVPGESSEDLSRAKQRKVRRFYLQLGN